MAKAKKQINPQNQSLENIPRIIINDSGAILHATAGLKNLANLKNTMPSLMEDVFSFLEPDEAFGRDGPRFFMNTPDSNGDDATYKRDSWVSQIIAGTHMIRLHHNETDYPFRFDWIDGPDQKKILIASLSDMSGQSLSSPPPSPDILKELGIGLDTKKPKPKKRKSRPVAVRNADLKHFLNMSHEAMIILDMDGNMARSNQTFTDILGYEDKNVQQDNFLNIVHPDDRHPVRRTLQSLQSHIDGRETMQHSPVVDFEARMICNSGGTRWMEWRLKVNDTKIYAVGSDVTEIKLHENTLTNREMQLSQAEAIGHMGHWHWVVGDDMIQWSDEIFRIFGVEKDDFDPSLDSLTKAVHKRDIGRVLQAFQRAVIEQNDYDMEFSIRRPDGEVRFIRCEGRCQENGDGEVVALYGIMQDITERTLYESDLKHAKDSAERAYAAKSQFLANMSHELRTPLNAIIGFSEMMQRQLLGPVGNERYLDYITGIRESGEHLLDLISDILDMSKIEAGKYELDLEEVNITKIIRLAMHMMEGRALDSSIKLDSSALDNLEITLMADRRAIMQVMLNLLSNAIKFTHDGGKVTLECEDKGTMVAIKVQDTGIGIPANKLQSITRPFEQVSSSYAREHEGSGLGLAITKELVELHGGNLVIESQVGAGTCVTVRLPQKSKK